MNIQPLLLPGVICYDTTITGLLPLDPGSDLSRLNHQFDIAANSLQIDQKIPTKWGFFVDASQNLFFIIHSVADVDTIKKQLAYGSECWAWMLNNGNQEFQPDEPETFDNLPEPLGDLLTKPPSFLRSVLPAGHNCLVQAVGHMA